jgi:hypothetical protein
MAARAAARAPAFDMRRAVADVEHLYDELLARRTSDSGY